MKRTITLRIGVESGGLDLNISQVYLTDKELIAVSELKPKRERGGGVSSYIWKETQIEVEVKDDAPRNFLKLPVNHYVVCDNREGTQMAHNELMGQHSSESCSFFWKFFEKAPTKTIQFIDRADEVHGLNSRSMLIYSKDQALSVRAAPSEVKRP